MGGYHLNHGHNTCTRETLAQVYNPMFHALPPTPGAWAAVPALEREWPLTPGDLVLIKRQHDALTLGRHLIEKHCPDWFMAWREVVEAEHTVTASVCPRVGLAQHCTLLHLAGADAVLASCLLANLNSVVVDFCARQKMSGRRLTPAILDQLPVAPPTTYAVPCAWDHAILLRDWVAPRALELVYTSPGLAPLARDCGYDGPAFPWDAARRRWLHSELEAAYCLIYGLTRTEVIFILETCMPGRSPQPSDAASSEALPISQLILQVYDAMYQARETGTAYHSPLAPPPAAPYLGQERPQRMQRNSTESHVHQVDPRPADKYKTCVPLLDLHVVAGAFVEGEDVESELWYGVPPGGCSALACSSLRWLGMPWSRRSPMVPIVCSNANMTNGHTPCKGVLCWPSTAISTILRLEGTILSGATLRNSALGRVVAVRPGAYAYSRSTLPIRPFSSTMYPR